MELFPDGAFVRLRSRVRDTYVHADEDARWVSLRPLGALPSLNAVWKVQHWPYAPGAVFLFLQGVAYGRYLAVSDQRAPLGHLGVRAIQLDYNSPNLEDPFMWRAYWVEEGENYVRLRNYQYYLRANGRYLHMNNVVTVEVRNGNMTTMMHWTVEAIPPSPVPPPLPLPPPPLAPIHVSRALMKKIKKRTRPVVHPHPGRTIRHVRADDEGHFDPDHDEWSEFGFFDHSVLNLRNEVALRQYEDDGNNILDITLCVRAGLHARLVPLVVNLPHNLDPMDIVAFTNESPAAAMLQYPQLDAAEP